MYRYSNYCAMIGLAYPNILSYLNTFSPSSQTYKHLFNVGYCMNGWAPTQVETAQAYLDKMKPPAKLVGEMYNTWQIELAVSILNPLQIPFAKGTSWMRGSFRSILTFR